jgi:hypothetical protein
MEKPYKNVGKLFFSYEIQLSDQDRGDLDFCFGKENVTINRSPLLSGTIVIDTEEKDGDAVDRGRLHGLCWS